MTRQGKSGMNVVPLRGAREDMRFPVIAEVRAYWEALRNGRPLPMRSEVDPRGIERALEHAFILERIAPGMARFRLAGMHLNDLIGMEVRGMPLSAFFAPAARDQIGQVLESLFSRPEIVELTLIAERGIGRPSMDAKLLLLPLRSDMGEVNRALGCLVSVGPIGRAPRRFDIAGVRVTPIAMPDASVPAAPKAGTRAGLRPQAPLPAESVVASTVPRAKPAPGFAEQAASFAPPRAEAPPAAPVPSRTDGKERPYLRLVKSND